MVSFFLPIFTILYIESKKVFLGGNYMEFKPGINFRITGTIKRMEVLE